MRVDVATLFPAMVERPLRESILGRAIAAGRLEVRARDIREHAAGRHRTADEYPYGGGAGMVLKPEPVFGAVEAAIAEGRAAGLVAEPRVILLSAQGRPFTQTIAEELSRLEHLVLICGHYEGVDERVREHLAADEISIGDYVLTGGELAALVIVDAVARLLPGVLGDPTSLDEESHTSGLLEYPHYTRPPRFRGWEVPEILLSGDHGRIARWRREQALARTLRQRPDMLARAPLTAEDRLFLADLGEERFLDDEARVLAARRARRLARRAAAARRAQAPRPRTLGEGRGEGDSRPTPDDPPR